VIATRPVFVPVQKEFPGVEEVAVRFEWFPGFSPSQKKRSVASLHATAAKRGLGPLLEISTKSEDALGQALSAFNFEVPFGPGRVAKLEAVYHSSKVFQNGGPFPDLVAREPRDAKRDPRLTSHGDLVGFAFGGSVYPLVPRRAFYDWLYLRALNTRHDLLARTADYEGFTDIEFNPERSVNSQAHAVALAVSLYRRGWLPPVARRFSRLVDILSHDENEMGEVNPQRRFQV